MYYCTVVHRFSSGEICFIFLTRSCIDHDELSGSWNILFTIFPSSFMIRVRKCRGRRASFCHNRLIIRSQKVAFEPLSRGSAEKCPREGDDARNDEITNARHLKAEAWKRDGGGDPSAGCHLCLHQRPFEI